MLMPGLSFALLGKKDLVICVKLKMCEIACKAETWGGFIFMWKGGKVGKTEVNEMETEKQEQNSAMF